MPLETAAQNLIAECLPAGPACTSLNQLALVDNVGMWGVYSASPGANVCLSIA